MNTSSRKRKQTTSPAMNDTEPPVSQTKQDFFHQDNQDLVTIDVPAVEVPE